MIKGDKNLFEEIIADNFPNQKKETDIQVWEVQRIPNTSHREKYFILTQIHGI